MSENAVKAYENGEKPMSKWNKSEIINQLEKLITDNDLMKELKKLNLQTLQEYFLENSSWHHTGKFANRTNFYKIDDSMVNTLLKNKEEILIKLKSIMESNKREAGKLKKEKAKEIKNEYTVCKIRIRTPNDYGIEDWTKKYAVVIGDWAYLDENMTKKAIHGKNVEIYHIFNKKNYPFRFTEAINGIIKKYESRHNVKLVDSKIKNRREFDR